MGVLGRREEGSVIRRRVARDGDVGLEDVAVGAEVVAAEGGEGHLGDDRVEGKKRGESLLTD